MIQSHVVVNRYTGGREACKRSMEKFAKNPAWRVKEMPYEIKKRTDRGE